jgi:hypothetical protein|tara:strand:+ start:156 stop:356 length:201 start_codon:yes stop_codon:yes gene_type:complete
VINCRRAENEIGTILKSWGIKVADTYLFMPLGCEQNEANIRSDTFDPICEKLLPRVIAIKAVCIST